MYLLKFRFKRIKKIKFIIFFLILYLLIAFCNKKNFKVAIATLVKMENNYIKEWIDHYYHLGFKKIFIYDNNDINGEKLEDVIDKYISHNFVEIITSYLSIRFIYNKYFE